MVDMITASARAAAEHLTAEYGHGLAAEVEAALHSSRSEQLPDYYLDPISVGSLIVSIATLAWTVYVDLRKKSPDIPPDVLGRAVRAELKNNSGATPIAEEKITDIIVTEMIRVTRNSRPNQ